MYNATIAKIQSLAAHPNADKIQLAKVLGEQVVVGLDVQVGDLGIYFPVDGQLSHKFCELNALYNKSTRMALGLPEGPTGFFDKNRRVRAQAFRGQKSEGFWMPFESVKSGFIMDNEFFPEGLQFTSIGGVEICNKYETQATINARSAGAKKAKRGETLMFRKHTDTDQFRHKWEEIPDGSLIYLTEKLHGTSGRYGLVQDDAEPTYGWRMAEKVLAYFGYQRSRWAYLHGTRNVILGRTDGEGFYGSDQFRHDAVKDLVLRKGEVLYFELVGDTAAGSPIMNEVKVDKKELPEIHAQYGDLMRYRYGANMGECRLYVYRIVMMNEDGHGTELSWPQVKKRCGELNLQHVPELGIGEFDPCDDQYGMRTMGIWHTDDCSHVKRWIEEISHGPSLLDHTHIREGVAVRVETPDGRIYTLKEKSFEFKFLEGIVKSANVVDLEEAS